MPSCASKRVTVIFGCGKNPTIARKQNEIHIPSVSAPLSLPIVDQWTRVSTAATLQVMSSSTSSVRLALDRKGQGQGLQAAFGAPAIMGTALQQHASTCRAVPRLVASDDRGLIQQIADESDMP